MLQNGKLTSFIVLELFRDNQLCVWGSGVNLPPTPNHIKVKARETYMEWLNDLFGYAIPPANVNTNSVDIVIYMFIPRNSDTKRTNLEPTANVLGLHYLFLLIEKTMIIKPSKKSKVISHISLYK